MPLYQNPQWSVSLPEGWHDERDEESTLFHRDGGSGTISVTLLCDNKEVTPEVLQELSASTREEGHSPSDIQSGALHGLYFCYEEEGTQWREWFLAAGRCLFFVSYDCPEEAGNEALAEVEAIVASLTLKQ